MKINSLSNMDEAFPSRLRDLSNRPSTIYSKGEIPEYSLGIAIVGTRKPTAYGRQITMDLAGRLAERGTVIISGLAHGIDGIAHEAAVKARGKTIAVLACGVDRVYPTSHARLAEDIVRTGGAIISEYAPGIPPLQHRFLERNRLVSGLADIVIVTEAGLRSGTMNTVSHALEQGRDVYVVPGPITSAMSAGCNALISQGALPIVNIEQFVDSILPITQSTQQTLLADNPAEQTIIDLLRSGISDGETLQKESGLDATLFSQTLTMLELRGAVKALGANRWGV